MFAQDENCLDCPLSLLCITGSEIAENYVNNLLCEQCGNQVLLFYGDKELAWLPKDEWSALPRYCRGETQTRPSHTSHIYDVNTLCPTCRRKESQNVTK